MDCLFYFYNGLYFNFYFRRDSACFALTNLSIIFIIIFISNYKILRLRILVFSIIIFMFLTIQDHKLYHHYIKHQIQEIVLNELKKKFFSTIHDSLIQTR